MEGVFISHYFDPKRVWFDVPAVLLSAARRRQPGRCRGSVFWCLRCGEGCRGVAVCPAVVNKMFQLPEYTERTGGGLTSCSAAADWRRSKAARARLRCVGSGQDGEPDEHAACVCIFPKVNRLSEQRGFQRHVCPHALSARDGTHSQALVRPLAPRQHGQTRERRGRGTCPQAWTKPLPHRQSPRCRWTIDKVIPRIFGEAWTRRGGSHLRGGTDPRALNLRRKPRL